MNMMMTSDIKKRVRVRFPPSPTGSLHLGNARTMLFNWLFARQHDGEVVLRPEDTDRARSEQKYEIEIVEALRWLGLDWDEGVSWRTENGEWRMEEKGNHGPYRQSERGAVYKEYIEKLITEGKAYYCYCTKEELEAERQALAGQGLPPKYSGHCRNRAAPPEGRSPEVIRFKTPEVNVSFKDMIRDTVTFDASLFGDFIIAKDPETALYNFANVIDDALMNITHVIRGEEHLANTPKQILLQKALGFDEPVYAHLPLILASNRSKLSKRYADVALLSYRDRGYLPEAMVNFLALLGWHPQGDDEILSRDELVKQFDLKRVQKAGAVFNEEKLDWMNGEYIRRMPLDELTDRLREMALQRELSVSKEQIRAIAAAERARMKTLEDFFRLGGFFFAPREYDAKLLAWKNAPLPETKEALQKIAAALGALPDEQWSGDGLSRALESVAQELGRGAVYWPLRAALSGLTASPDPIEIATILGKEETLRRVSVGINKLGLF